MNNTVITPSVAKEIEELANDHHQASIARILSIKPKTVSDFIKKNGIRCMSAKDNRNKKTKKALTYWVVPGLKNDAAIGIERKASDRPPLSLIKRVVLNYFDLKEEEMQSKSRKGELVWARQLIHYLGFTMANKTKSFLGKEIGGKDHTTVINSLHVVKNRIAMEPLKARDCREIKGIIENLIA